MILRRSYIYNTHEIVNYKPRGGVGIINAAVIQGGERSIWIKTVEKNFGWN